MSNNNFSNSQNSANPTKSNGYAVVIIAILLLLMLYGCFSKFSGNNNSHESKCYWCGQTEQCYQYDLQYVDGYHPNGNYKFSHKIVYMSFKCADEARNSGKYTNVTMT